MKDDKTKSIKIRFDTYADLKAMAAILNRPMIDLVGDMTARAKSELLQDVDGEKGWANQAKEYFALVAERREQRENAVAKRESRKEYLREIQTLVRKWRWEGVTFSEIAQRLKSKGFKTVTGKSTFSKSMLHKLYNEDFGE
jgi:hypothetical protein